MGKQLHDPTLSSGKLRQEEFSIIVQQAMLEEEFLPELTYLQQERLSPRPEATRRLMEWIHSDMAAAHPQV